MIASDLRNSILLGDVIEQLSAVPDGSIDCCVTSPPYWGLRDYGVDGQIGMEPTPDDFVFRMVEVFREVRRVLRDEGTLWLNLGDSYAGAPGGGDGKNSYASQRPKYSGRDSRRTPAKKSATLKPKDLVGIPWRVALALQADGWWLRQDIVWHKPSPMPESVTDRCTKAHEYVFLLTKSPRYFYDADAIAELATYPQGPCAPSKPRPGVDRKGGNQGNGTAMNGREMRNARSVWTIASRPYPEAHFATFPYDLPERCIRAGCPAGGLVLDPFFGSGTTGYAARKNGRDFLGIELNPEYVELAEKRLGMNTPLFGGGH